MARTSGILLPISSLPGKSGIGTLGHDARLFVDFLSDSGQKYWQILPLGPTGYGNSPYQCYSAFAGNPLLIDLDELLAQQLLTETDLNNLPVFTSEKIEYDRIIPIKNKILKRAFIHFQNNFNRFKDEYYSFLGEHSWWLDDYSLFQALKEENELETWTDWKTERRQRDVHCIQGLMHEYVEQINFHRFIQFLFFRQWFALKEYAGQKGVYFIGDLPLYVSHDSADVWTNPDIFLLDENGKPTLVGGVPPDYFSETGQLWGNPVFNWPRLKEREYDWWMARIHFNLRMFALVRIDHFRGLESFWAIPADEKTAINGEWMPANGRELLSLLKGQIGELPIIAEDLGLITQEVEQLRDEFQLPGMKILQFAFSSDEKNDALPHNITSNFIVYSGTHDNDTSVGWYQQTTRLERKMMHRYLHKGNCNPAYRIIETAWSSSAKMAIIPMQDLLQLGSSARMNTPGTVGNNWNWRFEWKTLKNRHRTFLKHITVKYNRKSE